MTKKEQEKIAKEERRAFVDKAFERVMKAVRSTQKLDNKATVKVTMVRGNRYVHCHMYQQDFNVQIYKSGDVDIEFREACYGSVKIRVYVYSENKDNQDNFLKRCTKDMKVVLAAYAESVSWHILLAYFPPVSEELTTDTWCDAFKASVKYAKS